MDWHADRYADHPLVGRIWRPGEQAWSTAQQLRTDLSRSRFVLLGETHDNPDHHRLQAQLLEAMAAQGRHPAVAFEMLDLGQQPALGDFLRSRDRHAADLGPAVDWAASGWPAWSMYAPIATVALDNDLEIVAANLPREQVKAVVRQGFQALGPGKVAQLGLDQPLPAPDAEAMLDEIYLSHCKLMPKAALAGMVDAQRARNAIMALRMRESAGSGGAVLIAGAGHARSDYGVPLDLRRDAPDADVLSVAMVEVQPGQHQPSEYADRYAAARLPFDYVLFTPAVEREDPCERLQRQFGAGKAQAAG